MHAHPDVDSEKIMPYAIEENVWQAIENLFMASPTARNLVAGGKAKLVGAIYDVGTGKVELLPEAKVEKILNRAQEDPQRALNPMADEDH